MLAAAGQHRPAAPIAGHGLPRLRFAPGGIARRRCGCGPATTAGAREREPSPRTCPPRPRPARRPAGGGRGRPGRRRYRATCGIGGQQVWPGPALAQTGRSTLWLDQTQPARAARRRPAAQRRPSRLGCHRAGPAGRRGARPAGRLSPLAGSGMAIEMERTVNAAGLARLAAAPGQRRLTSWPGSRSRCGWTAPDAGHHRRRGTGADHALPGGPGDRYRLRAPPGAASLPPPSGPVDGAASGSPPGGGITVSHPEDRGRDDRRGQIVTSPPGTTLPVDRRRAGRRSGAPNHHRESTGTRPTRRSRAGEGGDRHARFAGMPETRPNWPSRCNSRPGGWPATPTGSVARWNKFAGNPAYIHRPAARGPEPVHLPAGADDGESLFGHGTAE